MPGAVFQKLDGVPISMPVRKPSSAGHYQPPLLKARAHCTKAKARMSPVVGGSTSTSQPDAVHLATAYAISEQPGLGKIPIGLLLRIVPGLTESIAKNKTGGQSNSSVGGDVGKSELGIISDSMANGEGASLANMGVPAMKVPPVQLPEPSPPMAEQEQPPLVEQLQSAPAISDNNPVNSMGFSAAVPTVQFPDWCPTMDIPERGVPTVGLLTAEATKPPFTIEEFMGEAGTQSIEETLDEILKGCFVDFERPEVV